MSSPLPQPVVSISLDQFYQEVRALHDSMARIETKLDSMAGFEGRLRELENHEPEKKFKDFETRLRELESRRLPHQLLGLLATVLGTAALMWQALRMK